jgi:hypothetical protein
MPCGVKPAQRQLQHEILFGRVIGPTTFLCPSRSPRATPMMIGVKRSSSRFPPPRLLPTLSTAPSAAKRRETTMSFLASARRAQLRKSVGAGRSITTRLATVANLRLRRFMALFESFSMVPRINAGGGSQSAASSQSVRNWSCVSRNVPSDWASENDAMSDSMLEINWRNGTGGRRMPAARRQSSMLRTRS